MKLYPEYEAEVRLKIRGVKKIYCFCNRDGLFYIDVNKHIDGRTNSMMIQMSVENLKKWRVDCLVKFVLLT